MESLAQDITQCGLQLNVKTVISSISGDFSGRWSNVLKDAMIKHLRLFLKNANEFSNNANGKFDKTVKFLYPHTFSREKERRHRKV